MCHAHGVRSSRHRAGVDRSSAGALAPAGRCAARTSANGRDLGSVCHGEGAGRSGPSPGVTRSPWRAVASSDRRGPSTPPAVASSRRRGSATHWANRVREPTCRNHPAGWSGSRFGVPRPRFGPTSITRRVVRSPTAAIGSYREGGAGTPAAESILENGAAVTHWTNHFLGRRCRGHVGSRSGPRRGCLGHPLD